MTVIGLGLDHRLLDLRRSGAITYEGWQAAGLTRVDSVAAMLSAASFERSFEESADRATVIRFDVTDVDVARALRDGPNGFVNRNYTNAELYRVLNNPLWHQKTEFALHGGRVRFENGQFVP
jgi:hypothetical protein